MWLFVALALSVGCSSRGGSEDTPSGTAEEKPTDAGQVLQAVLDHESLAAYFHVDTLPERKPLVILRNRTVPEPLEPSLEAFGEPVVHATAEEIAADERPFVEVTRLDVRDGEALVELRYPPEGIHASVTLARQQGAWQVLDSQIVER